MAVITNVKLTMGSWYGKASLKQLLSTDICPSSVYKIVMFYLLHLPLLWNHLTYNIR